MRRLFLLAALVVLSIAAPVAAQASSTTISIPINMVVFLPCANGGAGEFVQLSGQFNLVYSSTVDPHDVLHFSSLADLDVNAVGLTTGDTYQVVLPVPHSVLRLDVTNYGYGVGVAIDGMLVGPGPNNRGAFDINYQFDLSQDGTVTALDNFSLFCE
jgi:opacity protein-like surface antigen